MATQFKVCRCCGTQAGLRKRVCPQCGVPAIWDTPTAEQIAERRAAEGRHFETIRKLMGDDFAKSLCGEVA